ncbi:MAG TPA: ribokinase [Granulicella sp.]|jgi:ribokinase|nr:ribokinase [Granulicella sp.]
MAHHPPNPPSQSEQKPILVVGSINMDLVVSAERLPAPGETLHGTGFETHPGGKGANQAVAVARLGYPVAIIGMTGSDDLGQQLRAHLGAAGVDTAAVGTAPGPSGVAVITVAASGENTIVLDAGANRQLTPAYLDQHAHRIADAGLVLAQLEIPLETTLHLAHLCAAANVPLILDPAPACDLPEVLFTQTAWFTPNATEASFYTGSQILPTPAATARNLLTRGSAGVILKLGAEGSYLLDHAGNEASIPPFPVHAVDSTAAGDAFNGAFATALMLGRSPRDSAIFASAAAALSVTRAGAQSSMPPLSEVEATLSN